MLGDEPPALRDAGHEGGVTQDRLTLRLYETQRESLVGYASRLLGDRARAEDIVHDAWLIFDQLPDRTAIKDPVAYLRRMIHNLAVNAQRRATRYQAIAGGDMDMATRSVADRTPSPEAGAMARQDLARFVERLARLPERQREAIRMHRLEGRKMREIAGHFGISVAMVHHLIADGLTKCADPRDEGD